VPPPLDPKIDDLYKGPLAEFVARRAVLAKTLAGEEARRVKGLQKPTVVPWAVNQVYWHARPVYDRLAVSGEKLRAAQIAALKGKANDVRRATEAHRKAMRDAVAEALRLASESGAHPSADELTKTLEAVSLAPDLPEQPGRLTKPLQPAGFEALAGVPVKAVPRAEPLAKAGAQAQGRPFAKAGARPYLVTETPSAAPKREVENRRAKQKEIEEERRRKKAAERATQAVARARAVEARARTAWERAKRDLAEAELALSSHQRSG
jgi:hypothetical protein